MQIRAYKLASIGEYPAMIQSKNGSGQEVIVRSHINNNSDIDWYYSYMLREVKSRPVNYQLIKLFGDEKETDVRYSLSFDSKRINLKNTSSKVRGSELVLMLAESYYHKKEYDKALEQINYLRSNRISNAKIYTINNLPELDSNSVIKEDCTGEPISKLLSLILNERRKELYMEGDRWFELKRNGRPELWIISNGLKYTTYKYLYTAPIYKGDIDINSKLIQNEGYIY
jgi:SusD family.